VNESLSSTAPVGGEAAAHRAAEVLAAKKSQPPSPEETRPAADDLPVTVIEPRPGWHLVDFREMWRFRELLFFLVWRDVKVRYKQTVLGAGWSVAKPLATMLVFAVFLGVVMDMRSNPLLRESYSLFLLAGIVPWTFLSSAVPCAGDSVVNSTDLITKISFPRLLLPLASVGANLVDFAIAWGMLLLMIAGYWVGGYYHWDWTGPRVLPGWQLLLAPVIVLLMAILALGVGALMAALTVTHRDFRTVMTFAIPLWMFSTPTIFFQMEVGTLWQKLLPLNPAYGLIFNFRECMLGRDPDLYSLGVSSAVSFGLLLLGCLYFRKVERGFADVI
jgi:lipopolysaccharide transport system permease protein